MIEKLYFALSSDDPNWPPVGLEAIPVEESDEGFRVLVLPLFIKNLSVGDLIDSDIDPVNGSVFDWKHVEKSKRSTVWLFVPDTGEKWYEVKQSILELNCNIASFEQCALHAIDLPSEISLAELENLFSVFEADDSFAIAYPSLRHPVE